MTDSKGKIQEQFEQRGLITHHNSIYFVKKKYAYLNDIQKSDNYAAFARQC